jgi:hypothetical protein
LRPEGDDPSVRQRVREVVSSVERLERREQLLLPAVGSEFVAALWWMIQEGSEVRDLAAVRSAKAFVETQGHPLLRKGSVGRLLHRAERAILEHLNDPAEVARKGEEAYRARRELWERMYAGQFIAIVQGDVVAYARDKSELLREVAVRQKEMWPFRAYIVKVGAPPPPPVRGPAPRILSRKHHPADDEEML